MPRTTDPDVLMLQAAADPIRLQMLRQLSLGVVCACDFAADAEVSQPTISHHLRVLREAGWVTTERRGTWIYYSINPDAMKRFSQINQLIGIPPTSAATGRRLPVVEAQPARA
ncbi:MAG: metalloregulator ArsR/SmtB family transcription factor [Candidatus Limnocylindrales bacterium]